LYDEINPDGLLLDKLLTNYVHISRITADIPGESTRIYYTEGRNNLAFDTFLKKGVQGVYLSRGLNLESDYTNTVIVFNGANELNMKNIKDKSLHITGPILTNKGDIQSGSWKWNRIDK